MPVSVLIVNPLPILIFVRSIESSSGSQLTNLIAAGVCNRCGMRSSASFWRSAETPSQICFSGHSIGAAIAHCFPAAIFLICVAETPNSRASASPLSAPCRRRISIACSSVSFE